MEHTEDEGYSLENHHHLVKRLVYLDFFPLRTLSAQRSVVSYSACFLLIC